MSLHHRVYFQSHKSEIKWFTLNKLANMTYYYWKLLWKNIFHLYELVVGHHRSRLQCDQKEGFIFLPKYYLKY